MRSLLCGLAAILALGASLPAHAAREFTPQAGLWMIPSENNGQPGRGFSLDVQGNMAFLQVFNYEKSGAATFHTAVGQLDATASMTVPLQRFKGGRYLGGPARDAVEDGAAGNVTVTFTDGLNGTVQFPGEAVQPIARLLIPETLPFWWLQQSNLPPTGDNGHRKMQWTAQAQDGTRHAWDATLRTNDAGGFQLVLDSILHKYSASTDFYYQVMNCHMEAATQIFDCVQAPPSAEASGLIATVNRVRFRMFGRDVVGVAQPVGAPQERLTVNGWTLGSYSSKAPNYGAHRRTTQTYVSADLKPGDCILGGCDGYNHATILAVSGAWVIDSEVTGKPGRGIFLDIQEGTVVIQTSDYMPNGEPTFHMGAGRLQGALTFEGSTTADIPLVRYAGGRYFGGPPQSGREMGSPGRLQLQFPRFVDNAVTNMATGFITLPGEPPQRIRRLSFEASSGALENLLGEYLVYWNVADAKYERVNWLTLTRVKDNIAMNSDGTKQCFNQNFVLKPYALRCAWLRTADLRQPWSGIAELEVAPFYRDGGASTPLIRTRDKHGNWLGLGAVNLPELAIPPTP